MEKRAPPRDLRSAILTAVEVSGLTRKAWADKYHLPYTTVLDGLRRKTCTGSTLARLLVAFAESGVLVDLPALAASFRPVRKRNEKRRHG